MKIYNLLFVFMTAVLFAVYVEASFWDDMQDKIPMFGKKKGKSGVHG
jgi:hypothetical protein